MAPLNYRTPDTAREPFFDEITQQAARLYGCAFGMVLLFTKSGARVKSSYGCEQQKLPVSYFASARFEAGLFEVKDTAQDPRVACAPPVVNGSPARYYAGAPLRTPEGTDIGVLCVLDPEPKEVSALHHEMLSTLARLVMTELEGRRKLAEAEQANRVMEAANRIAGIGYWQHHHDGTVKTCAVTDEIAGIGRYGISNLAEGLACVHPLDRARVHAAHKASLCGEELVDLEFRLVLPNGEVRWVRQCGQLLPDLFPDGPVVVGTLQNITEAKAFSDDMEILSQNTSAIFSVMSPTGERRRVNPAFQRVLGWSEEDILGRSIWDNFYSEDIPLLRAALAKAKPSEPFEVEARAGTKSGEYRTLAIIAVIGEDGAIYSVARDVSEQRKLQAELQIVTQKLQHTLDSIPDAVAVYDDYWVCTYLNPAGVRFAELTGKSFLGKMLWEAFPETVGSTCELKLRKAIASGTPVTFEFLLEGLDVWYEVRVFPRPDGVVVFYRDIDAAKRATEALRISEERFAYVAKVTKDVLWDVDVQAQTMWWSEGFETHFGHRAGTWENGTAKWLNLIHPDEQDEIRTAMQESRRSGTYWEREYRLRRSNGTYAYVLARGNVIRDSSGAAIKVRGSLIDLTERHAAEAKLREQAALIEQARDAIMVRKLDGKITFWNRAAADLYGYTADEVIGRSLVDLGIDDRSRFEAANAQLMNAGVWTGELTRRTRSGQTLIIDARWTLLRDAMGRPQSVLAINTDITEKKKLELQYQRAQRMESVGVLAGGIAHDLNNMLTPLLMGAGLLKGQIQDPGMRSILDSMEMRAQKGASLIRQVLTFARGVKGEFITVNARSLLKEFKAITLGTLPAAISLDMKIEENLWDISADPTQLHQVILALCQNASDAMPHGGNITIRASNQRLDTPYDARTGVAAPGPYIVIEVADQGCGIPEELYDKIFQALFTTKAAGEGTGLGLTNASAVVKAHRGVITFESETGRGTAFRVLLPAIAPAAQPAPAPTAIPQSIGGTILIIDDDASIREVAKMTLEAKGYRVLTAEDGADGLALFSTHSSEIVLVMTDMMMPVLNVANTIFAIRRMSDEVAIVAASGLGRDRLERDAMRAGANAFLHKPFTTEKLLEAVSASLSKSLANTTA